jgi:hypothetical protein
MKEFVAIRLFAIGKSVEHLDKVYLHYSDNPKGYTPSEKESLKDSLESILQDLDFLSLPTTRAQCERIIANIETIPASEMRQRYLMFAWKHCDTSQPS